MADHGRLTLCFVAGFESIAAEAQVGSVIVVAILPFPLG